MKRLSSVRSRVVGVVLATALVVSITGLVWLRAQEQQPSESTPDSSMAQSLSVPQSDLEKVASTPKVSSASPTQSVRDLAKPLSRSEMSTPVILSAILQLESSHDAKCHSSACRFENFLFGTPLTEDGRAERMLRQRQFVHWIWTEASRSARDANQTAVTGSHVEPIVETVVRSEEDGDGNIQITFGDQPSLTLSKIRFRQYTSIAYSLRAILSVQQESLLLADASLASLDESGVDALRRALDLVTISVLMRADREARDRNIPQVGQDAMSAAWEALVPGLAGKIAGNAETGDPKSSPDGDKLREQAFGVLGGIVDKKISAYEAYNNTTEQEGGVLFVNNVYRYYVRFPLGKEGENAGEWRRPFRVAMVGFASRLLLDAQQRATDSGNALVRARDAQQAVQKFTPHEIDVFEDVHFFNRLSPADRFVLEAYDCDSFRDFGLHWRLLRSSLEQTPNLTMAPDPFAAEIIAEAISQYGVLLLRAAGQIAEDRLGEYLRGPDVSDADERLRHLALEHHATPVAPASLTSIVSAHSSDPEDSAASFFTDVTADSGVAFLHRSSRWLSEFRRRIPTSPPTFSGGGIAADDINNDGSIDLLFVGGNGNTLYLNDGTGRFRDITNLVDIQTQRPDGTNGEPRQPLIVDFDNDGFRDILITYANDSHRLYRNLNGVSFEDVTADSGLGGEGEIGGPATVFDFDGDGLLDIYICNFGDYLHGAIPTQNRNNTNALPNRLFRNLGNFRFEDVTEGSGAADTGWTQAVSHTDFDRDGRQDIIVANDFGRNAFLRNLGNGRFENVAPSLGLNKAFHSMNVGICDLNRDDYPDVYISNIATLVKDNKYVNPDLDTPLNFDPEHMATMLVKESDVLYLSVGDQKQLAEYVPADIFERGPTSTGWAWDAEFFDCDNDGDDDLYVVNGANDYKLFSEVYQQEDSTGQTKFYRQTHAQESNVLFVNEEGKFKNRSSQSGADFVGNSRSTAYLDMDNDGDLDVAINNFHAPATMLRNNAETRGHNWIKILLVGNPEKHTNRDAVGARMIAVTDSGMYITREIQCGSGYLSMNPKQQHFGLGKSSSIDLKIVWPNGETQKVEDLPANNAYVIHQGSNGVESIK